VEAERARRGDLSVSEPAARAKENHDDTTEPMDPNRLPVGSTRR
jgi:hypothetical protein